MQNCHPCPERSPRGAEIGVTLPHPHGQIYSYPFVTPRTRSLLTALEREGPDLFERVIAAERRGSRALLETEHWVYFVPYAARWPVELHLLPKRRIPDFAVTSADERDDLAVAYLRILKAVDSLYGTPTPNFAAWHHAPVREARDTVRLNLQLTSPRRSAHKLKYLAGSEAAMNAWVAPRPDMTERLQAVLG